MFRPERMRLVAVMAPEAQVEILTAAIAREGILHLVDAPKLPGMASTAPRQRGRFLLERIVALEERAIKVARTLELKSETRPRVSLASGADSYLERLDLKLTEIERTLKHAENIIVDAHAEEARLAELSLLLEPIEQLGITVDELSTGQFNKVFIGFISSENVDAIRRTLSRGNAGFSIGYGMNGRNAICVATSVNHAEEISSLLSASNFTAMPLPSEITGTVDEAREQLEISTWAAREDEAEAKAVIEALARDNNDAVVQWVVELAALRRIEDASLRYATTGTHEIIAGWTPTKKINKLRKLSEQIVGGRVVVTEIPEAEADMQSTAPTKLSNPPVVRAFESVIGLYGTPRYDGIDPTIFFALSFTLMYGFMFGDIGHGLVLAGIGLFARWMSGGENTGIRNMGEVLVACGISGTIFGVLGGSFFCNEHIFKSPVFAPLAKTQLTLGIGLLIGAVMHSLGVILNVVQRMMRRQWADAFIGEWGIASLVIYWTLIGFLIYSVLVPEANDLMQMAFVTMLIVPYLLMVFRGPISKLAKKLLNKKEEHANHADGHHDEGMAAAIIEASVVLLEMVTATLSHIRISAFALSHAILCVVVYSIAGSMSGADSTAGDVITRYSILIFGNVIIIGLEGMIVFIQVMRLHFYEFFSKFFDGIGIPFKPLSIED